MSPYLARHERISFAMRPLESYSGTRICIFRARHSALSRTSRPRADSGTFTHTSAVFTTRVWAARERDSGYWVVARAKYRPRRGRRSGRIDRSSAGENPTSREAKCVPVSILGDEGRIFRFVPVLVSSTGKYRRGIRIRGSAEVHPCVIPTCHWNLSTTLDPVELAMLENLLIVTSKSLLQLFNLYSRQPK